MPSQEAFLYCNSISKQTCLFTNYKVILKNICVFLKAWTTLFQRFTFMYLVYILYATVWAEYFFFIFKGKILDQFFKTATVACFFAEKLCVLKDFVHWPIPILLVFFACHTGRSLKGYMWVWHVQCNNWMQNYYSH